MQGGPNLYGPRRLGALNGIRVRGVFSGPVSCHSVIITEEGKAYSWGECNIIIIIIIIIIAFV